MQGQVVKHICTFTVGWACAQTQGEWGELGPYSPSAATFPTVPPHSPPRNQQGHSQHGTALGTILHQLMWSKSPRCRCPHMVTAAVAGHKASKRLPHHLTGDVSCSTTTHEQAAGCCSNMSLSSFLATSAQATKIEAHTPSHCNDAEKKLGVNKEPTCSPSTFLVQNIHPTIWKCKAARKP